ncbi:MAG: hypothetical protein ACPLRM_01505 [Anaerolineae bacterium]
MKRCSSSYLETTETTGAEDMRVEILSYYEDLVSLSLEEICQRAANQVELQDDCKWELGRLVSYLITVRQFKAADIGSKLGCSAAQVRELARTFMAFPDESFRAKDLSWYHHRLAARTEQPGMWIDLAVVNGWSTRDMVRAIAVSQGASESSKEEEGADREKAMRLLRSLLEIKAAGGSTWEWLKKNLMDLLKEANERCEAA